MYSFEWLIDPVLPTSFLTEFFEQKHLLIQREEPAKFAHVLSVDVIDQFLASHSALFIPDLMMADAAREIKSEEYSFPQSQPAGRIDLPRVYKLFHSGATIILNSLQERVPELAALCRAVEHTFSARFQTNIYLSPANTQGFKTHYDSHDVFILQVAGSKNWTLYDSPVWLPLRAQTFDPAVHKLGLPIKQFTLKQGDLLYCPRGLLHSARSTDESSLHITLGLMGRTWTDLLIEVVSAFCLENPSLRKSLPVGFARPNFANEIAITTFRDVAKAFSAFLMAGDDRCASILDTFAEEFVTSKRPDLSGCLREANRHIAVDGDTMLAPRDYLAYRIRQQDEKIVLIFASTEMTLPEFTREALEFALRGGAFIVSNLPGPLDQAGKIVLAQRLVKEGLLIRAS